MSSSGIHASGPTSGTLGIFEPPAAAVDVPSRPPKKKLSFIYDAYGLSGERNKGEMALYAARFVPLLNLLPVGAYTLSSVVALDAAINGYLAGDHKDPEIAKDLSDQLKFSILTGAQAANIFFGNAGALVAVEAILTAKRLKDAKDGID